MYPVETTPEGGLYWTTLTYWQRIIGKRVRHETTATSTPAEPTTTARSDDLTGGY